MEDNKSELMAITCRQSSLPMIALAALMREESVSQASSFSQAYSSPSTSSPSRGIAAISRTSPSAASLIPAPLIGDERTEAKDLITEQHYAHCVPSGKSHYYRVGDAYFIFAIPANKNIGRFLLGNNAEVWELSRMWAPDGHEVILTAALSAATAGFHHTEPSVAALVSYADPNVGHEGGVYRAASWTYTGQSEESRYYLSPDGQVVSRRKFHSGSTGMRKAEIEALGYRQVKRPGKHRYCKGLNRVTRRVIRSRWGATNCSTSEAGS